VGTRGARDDGPNGYEPRRGAGGPPHDGDPRQGQGPIDPREPPGGGPRRSGGGAGPANGPWQEPAGPRQPGPADPRRLPPGDPRQGPVDPRRSSGAMPPGRDPRQGQGPGPGDPRRPAGGPPPGGGYGPPPRQPDPRQGPPYQSDPRYPDPRQQPPRQPDPRTQPDPRAQSDHTRVQPRQPDPWEEPRRHRSREQEQEQDDPHESRGGSSHGRRRDADHGRSAGEPEQARPVRLPKSRHSATISVLLMTGVSLVAVGVLAVQANGQSPQTVTAAQNSKPVGAAPTAPGASSSANPSAQINPLAVPADSGSGKRIVYSIEAKRVWLIGSDGSSVQRTFQIVPGTIPAPLGTYHVSGRDSGETGSDGTSVQYVVFFDNPATVNSSTSFAFDAEADISGLPPAPTGHTGAVRTTQADAVAIWYFAPIGTTVTVV
jgi:hypothetical protein